jgi:hypothetical protein
VVTLPEYLKKRFGSLRIQLFFTFIFLIVYIFSRISVSLCTRRRDCLGKSLECLSTEVTFLL